MLGQHWARNFAVENKDVEFLNSVLLEREQPLSTEALARLLIDERLAQEAAAIRERFKDVTLYTPARIYETGQRIVFPSMNYAVATVKAQRVGDNPQYGEFDVIAVEFDDDAHNPADDRQREFAMNLKVPHKLSEVEQDDGLFGETSANLTTDEILAEVGDDIIYTLENHLQGSDSLVRVGDKWFPYDLLVEVNIGHLNLGEAVLDMNGGGPSSAEEILEQIGGLESGSPALQKFSLNYALHDDDRFDEVGPAGEVLWFLKRLEPAEVSKTPAMLQYQPIEYDRSLLTPEMLDLEREVADELTPDLYTDRSVRDEATITLIYPHRRIGTLPLNHKTRSIFPDAIQTSRISVTLVDGIDGEEYPGWVVPGERYVFGLDRFYRKHRLPIGAFVKVARGDAPNQIILNYNDYRPRTEWVRLIVPQGESNFTFENVKRSIGAEYDDLMIIGADDLEGVDALFEYAKQQRRSLASLLRIIIPALGRLSPQGTAHAKTIYSAVNAIKRCPPGPILVTLSANPDFEDVGGHYWKLAD